MSESAKQFVIRMSAQLNMNIGKHHFLLFLLFLILKKMFLKGAPITKDRDVGKNGSIFVKAFPQHLLMKLTEWEEEQGKVDYSGTNSPHYLAQSPKLNRLLKMSALLELTMITLMFKMMQITAGDLWHSVSGSLTKLSAPTSQSMFARWVKFESQNLWWTNDDAIPV